MKSSKALKSSSKMLILLKSPPLPTAPKVLTLKFTKGAGCRTPRSRVQNQQMQNQEPHAEHHFAIFLGVVVLIFRTIFWPLKRKLMVFSCHIQLSRVTPWCVMLWRSPEMNFHRHPRVTKLFCNGSPLNRSRRRTYCKILSN